MSDARNNGSKAHTDEAALSARLQRLGEGLALKRADATLKDAPDNRAATASGFAKGLQLTSELVAGVVVGAGLGGLIDHWLGVAPLGLVVFTLLGFVAGVLNVVRSAHVASARVSGDAQSQNKDG